MKIHFVTTLIACLCLTSATLCAKHKKKPQKQISPPQLVQPASVSNLSSFEISPQSQDNQNLGYASCNIDDNGEFLLMKQVIKPGYVVFDVGANIGEWSLKALSIEPSIHLVSFEPIPSVYEILKQNLQLHNSVGIWNLALADEEGRSAFYFYDESNTTCSGFSGFYTREVLKGIVNDPKLIEVDQDSLAKFCADHSINKIDFIKIDTEGAEWRILKGAVPLLQQGRIGAIQFEYGGCYVDAGTTLEQVYHLLTSNNYLVFRIIPTGLLHIDRWDNALENYRYSNYFAVLKSEQSRFLPTVSY